LALKVILGLGFGLESQVLGLGPVTQILGPCSWPCDSSPWALALGSKSLALALKVVLGLGFGLESQVLGLGPVTQILGPWSWPRDPGPWP